MRLFGWFRRKPRLFVHSYRISGCARSVMSAKALEREELYQKSYALIELCRELEHSGLLTITPNALTGDDRSWRMVLKI